MNLLVGLDISGSVNVPGLAQLDRSLRKLTSHMAGMNRSSSRLNKNMKSVARSTWSGESAAFQMARKLDLMNRSATKLRNSFIALAGGGIVAAALGSFIQKLGDVNDEFTKTQVRLAGLLVQNGNAKDFTEGRLKAKGLQKDLAFASAATPGTSQEFVNAFIRLQSATGMDYQRTKSLTRGLLVGGDAVRGVEGRKNIINDIQQALTSGISPRQTADLFTFLQSKGVTEADFDKLDKSGRLKAIEDAIAKLGPEIEALEQTFNFQKTTTQSLLEQLTVAASGRFVGGATATLRTGNDFVMEYFTDIQAVLEGFSPTLAVIATAGISAFAALGSLATALTIFGSTLILMAPGLATIFGGVTAASVGTTIAGAAGAVGLGGVVATAGSAVGFAGTLMSGLALPEILALMATVAAPIVALIATITVAISGFVVFLYKVPKAVEYLSKKFEHLLYQLQQFYFALANFAGVLYSAMEPFLLWVGSNVYNGLTTALDLTARFIRFLIDSGDTIGQVLFMLQAMRLSQQAFGKGDVGAAIGHMNTAYGFMGGVQKAGLQALDIWRPLDAFDRPETTGDLGVPNQITNINGDVNVNIKADTIDDPQRVAVAFETVLDEIANRKRGAARSGVRGR